MPSMYRPIYTTYTARPGLHGYNIMQYLYASLIELRAFARTQLCMECDTMMTCHRQRKNIICRLVKFNNALKSV